MARWSVGQTASLTRTFTQEAVAAFAELSGDSNPLHVDAAYAATTAFGRPIVHGPFTLTLLMTVLGTRLPGPGTVLAGVDARFLRPVFVGDTVEARVTVRKVDGRRLELELECRRDGEAVVQGTARTTVREA